MSVRNLNLDYAQKLSRTILYIYSVCSKSKKNIPLLCTMQCKICTSPYAISSSNVISYFEEKMISFFLKDFQMSFKSSYSYMYYSQIHLSRKNTSVKWAINTYFFVFHPILMKFGEVVVLMCLCTTTSPSFIKIG